MIRDRESIRTLTIECLDRQHGDCSNESCQCECHREDADEQEEIEEYESAC